MKKNEPIYEEIRSLSPFFLIISGIYMAVLAVIFFAAGYDYTLLVGGIYGIIIALKEMFVNYRVSHSFLKSLALQKSIPSSSM